MHCKNFWLNRRRNICLLLVGMMGLVSVHSVNALPFNQEMVGRQYISGTIMRAKPAGSVARGSLDRLIPSREAALKMGNPLSADEVSPIRGERLFRVNCSPCHGVYENGKHQPADIALKQLMPAPDITADAIIYYDPNEKTQPKPDGHYFGYIYLGGMAIMPAYGWKLSNTEVWDVVSYVRRIQAEAHKTAVAAN